MEATSLEPENECRPFIPNEQHRHNPGIVESLQPIEASTSPTKEKKISRQAEYFAQPRWKQRVPQMEQTVEVCSYGRSSLPLQTRTRAVGSSRCGGTSVMMPERSDTLVYVVNDPIWALPCPSLLSGPPLLGYSNSRTAVWDSLLCVDTGGFDIEVAHPSRAHSVIGSCSHRVWVFSRTRRVEFESKCCDATLREVMGNMCDRNQVGDMYIYRKILVFDPGIEHPCVTPVHKPPSIPHPRAVVLPAGSNFTRLALKRERHIRRRWPTVNRVSPQQSVSLTRRGDTLTAFPPRPYYYLGSCLEGRRHGWGRLIDDSHTILEGTWRHGRSDGWYVATHEYYLEMGFQCAFYRVGALVLSNSAGSVIPFAYERNPVLSRACSSASVRSRRCLYIPQSTEIRPPPDTVDSLPSYIWKPIGEIPTDLCSCHMTRSDSLSAYPQLRRCQSGKSKSLFGTPSCNARKNSMPERPRAQSSTLLATSVAPTRNSTVSFVVRKKDKATPSGKPWLVTPTTLGHYDADAWNHEEDSGVGATTRAMDIGSSADGRSTKYEAEDEVRDMLSSMQSTTMGSGGFYCLMDETFTCAKRSKLCSTLDPQHSGQPQRRSSYPGALLPHLSLQISEPSLLDVARKRSVEAPTALGLSVNWHQRVIRNIWLSGPSCLRASDLPLWSNDKLCGFLLCVGAYSAVQGIRRRAISGRDVPGLTVERLCRDCGVQDVQTATFVLSALKHLWNATDWGNPLLFPLWRHRHPVVNPVSEVALNFVNLRCRTGAGGHAIVYRGFIGETPAAAPTPAAFKLFPANKRLRSSNLALYLQRLKALSTPASSLRIPSPSQRNLEATYLTSSLNFADSNFAADSVDGQAKHTDSTSSTNNIPAASTRNGAVTTRQVFIKTSQKTARRHSASSSCLSLSPPVSKPNIPPFRTPLKCFSRWICRSLSPKKIMSLKPASTPPSHKKLSVGTCSSAGSSTSTNLPAITVEEPSTETTVSAFMFNKDTQQRSTRSSPTPDSSTCGRREVHEKAYLQPKGSAASRLRDYELAIMNSLPPHPSVLQPLGFFSLGTLFPALVLEFCEKGALDKHTTLELRSPSTSLRNRYEWPEIVRIFGDIAEGLAHLHRYGFFHRDIKPSNFLIDEYGHGKISDMGVAKSWKVDNPSPTFMAAYGNAYYAAPEVLRGEGFWPQSDVYSFGISFWEALTGKMIHEGCSRAQTIVRVATGRVDLRAPTNLSSELAVLLEEMLSYDYKLRPSFDDIAKRIKNITNNSRSNLIKSVQCFMGY